MESIIYLFIFLFGSIIGSFINCLIYRLHEGKTLGGRSFCPQCQHQIAWYDNIPIPSWLILRARCRQCGKSISIQYPVIELITGLLFLLAFYLRHEAGSMNYESGILSTLFIIHDSLFMIQILFSWLAIAVMTVIFLYDLKYYLILDKITLPSIVIFFAINLYLGTNWQNLLISGIIGGSFFLIQFVISQGKWIGGGDIRLGVLMGVILGWPLVIMAIFLAYIIGSIISLSLVVLRVMKWKSQVPLGVFLTVATLITLFWGQGIWDWYWNNLLFVF